MKLSNKLIVALFALFFLASTSANAVVVTWDLNPTNANGAVGSTSHTFNQSGYPITAYGFDRVFGPDTPHELYYKNVNIDHGLGLVNTLDNELQTNNYIQFDFNSILTQGFSDGQIKVSSVDPGESFNLYGSNTLGSIGTLLNGSPYGSNTNNSWIDIPNFGNYRYVSVIAAVDDVLPWAIRATVTPIPEASTVIPVILLVIGATAFEVRRRHRATA